MVGLVLAGMAVGPHAERSLNTHQIALSALGECGLLYLMFAAGLELVTFDRFVEERITKPLGMRDTAFYLTSKQAPRLAEPQLDPATGKRPLAGGADDLTKEKVKWFSGGGGMLSTAGHCDQSSAIFLSCSSV